MAIRQLSNAQLDRIFAGLSSLEFDVQFKEFEFEDLDKLNGLDRDVWVSVPGRVELDENRMAILERLGKKLKHLSASYCDDMSLQSLTSLASLDLEVDQNSTLEGLICALQAPSCSWRHLSIKFPQNGLNERLCSALTSVPSLESLELTVDGNIHEEQALQLLVQRLVNPACNIWRLRLYRRTLNSQILSHLGRTLQSPDCKLVDLGLDVYQQKLIAFDKSASEFMTGLRSKHCKLHHLMLRGVQSTGFIGELGKLCKDSVVLNSLEVHSGYSGFMNEEEKLLSVMGELLTSSLRSLVFDIEYEPENIRDKSFLSCKGQLLLELLPSCKIQRLDIGKLDGLAQIVEHLNENFNCPLETFRTNWDSDIMATYCSQIMERNKLYRIEGLAAQKRVEPTMAKLFICGNSGVGKTTIRKNLSRQKGILPKLQRHLSTYGIDMEKIEFDKKTLLMCDLAGQPEFHAFHHYFIRGSDKDLFLIVSKAPGKEDIRTWEDQLQYWLRFIVSHRTLTKHKPKVLIVLNYFEDSILPQDGWTMSDLAKSRCKEMVRQYSSVIDFGHAENSLFGLVATKVKSVKVLKEHLKLKLDELLTSRPKVPEICQAVILAKAKKFQQEKLIRMKHFRSKLGIQDHRLFKVAVSHLHDMGEVIYFDQEVDDEDQVFLILDVQWFVRDIIGVFLPRQNRTIDNLPAEQPPPTWMPIIQVEDMLPKKGCTPDDLPYIITSLNRLGVLLLDQKTKRAIVLSLLTERIQSWSNLPAGSMAGDDDTTTFWGRRLECKDSEKMLLPTGIFTMLQVRLASLSSAYTVGQGWWHLGENNIEMIVKVGGQRGHWNDRHWIDVLACIPEESNLDEAGRLFIKIKKCISEICGAYNWGCPAIELEEKIIKPECVKLLNLEFTSSPPVQVVPLAEVLEKNLLYKYAWPSEDHWKFEYSQVLKMVLPEERERYFATRVDLLDAIKDEVQECVEAEDLETTSACIDKSEDITLQDAVKILQAQIKILERHIKNHVTKEADRVISRISKLEERVLQKLASVQLQSDRIMSKLALQWDSKEPKYPYFVDNKNILQRFSSSAFGSSWKLHFLCEYGGCHPVEDQKGFPIRVDPEWWTKAAPVLIPALKILFFAGKLALVSTLGVPLPSLPKSVKDDVFKEVVGKLFGAIDKRLDESPTHENPLHKRIPTLEELQVFYKYFLGEQKLRFAADFGLFRNKEKGIWVCQEHLQ
ncbi:ROCO family protein [Selaginella moellendorffii]|uniref:ROCO family protein n=1 Tax=Selaginella moellendorffii TaxID=88036 RepID=D8T9Q3_SELML|nr:ROCO family protein [Selaginella moellendorffii]